MSTPGIATAALRSRVVGVLGATGGVGASTLAASIAFHAASQGWSTTLLDTDPWGGGADVLLGLERQPGLRWPDLAQMRGEVDRAGVLAGLPRHQRCAVLSWARGSQPAEGPPESRVAVAAALTTAAEVTVIDLPRPGAPLADTWWSLCDHLLLVIGGALRQLAGARRVLAAVNANAARGRRQEVAGVLRRSGRRGPGGEEVSRWIGLTVLGTVRDDPGLGAELARGLPVGRGRGPLRQVSLSVVDHALGHHKGAA